MGCRKLSYYQREGALGVNSIFFVSAIEKNDTGSKNCLNSSTYGFQGQEKDDEWTGTAGSHLNYKFRVYDARIGRFFAVDPLVKDYPHNSPYAFSENRVIDAIELEGKEAILVHGMDSEKKDWTTKGFAKVARCLLEYTNNTEAKTLLFDWSGKGNGLLQSKGDRTAAAERLVLFVLDNRDIEEEVTLIGVSHGGNVIIQASNILGEMGFKVNLITLNTSAYSGDDDIENPANSTGINDMIIINTKGDPVAPMAPGGAKREYTGNTPGQKPITIESLWRGGKKHATAKTDVEEIYDSELTKLKPVPKDLVPIKKD